MGNQLQSELKEHQLGEQTASGGQNCCWKIYNATRKGGAAGGKDSQQQQQQQQQQHGAAEVSLWIFDKKATPQPEVRNLAPYCDLLRKSVRNPFPLVYSYLSIYSFMALNVFLFPLGRCIRTRD